MPTLHDKVMSEKYQGIYNDPDGKAVFADIFAQANLYSPIATVDPIEAAREEGKRQLALHIVHMLSLQPTDFVQSAQSDFNILDNLMRLNDERR